MDDDASDENSEYEDFWANFTSQYSNQDDFTSAYEAVGKC